ncbi:hypothetical protein ABH940_004004 [Streptacidiphilus sp. BW17]
MALGLSVLLTALNWFAVRLFARFNNLVSIFKILVPVITVAALFASGFHSGRLTAPAHGGFAPYGYASVLSALAAGGIVYSLNGFQAPLDFSGEARNPRRTMPGSVLAGIGLALVLYLALQLAFLYTVPERLLGHGWSGVSFDSPFGQLALILNLQWLSSLLYADAVVSPGGSAYVGVGIDARHTYALAKNGTLPRFFMRVSGREGVTHRALLLNLAVIAVFLLPFNGWQQIVSVMGDMYLLIYAASAVAVAVSAVVQMGDCAAGFPGSPDRAAQLHRRQRVRVLVRMARSAPGVADGAHRPADLPPAAAGAPRGTPARGTAAWPLARVLPVGTDAVVLAGLVQGLDRLTAPDDSITVAVVSLAVFAWAVREGRSLPVAAPAAAGEVNQPG